jgi:hypothetical protein
VGFETTIPVFERAKRVQATVVGEENGLGHEKMHTFVQQVETRSIVVPSRAMVITLSVLITRFKIRV